MSGKTVRNRLIQERVSGRMKTPANWKEKLRRKMLPVPGILGREEYYSCAVLVPLLYLDGEEHLLFQKRAPHIKQGSEVCFPGGHFEEKKDTDLLDTALREAQEELGIMPGMVDVLGQLETVVSPRGIIVECFLGVLEISETSELVIDMKEVEKVFTVPVSWFRRNPPQIYRTRVEIQSSYVDRGGNTQVLLPVEELGLPDHYRNNRSEWMHRVVVYPSRPEIIWGMTAAVVENLVRKYFPAGSGQQGL
ncbi:MAG: CoA pyrophosphatase [Desulfopila sp.]|nr:CoA pyrophosphatase [Desulfopila sp.]